ncbi:MAG: RsmD family RNA methyltransferase [Flavobacteriales bacterium]
MRVISGAHKKRKIKAPKRLKARPTTDEAKEGLFNILGTQYDFDQIKVLDLFTGTGNISFEFASRGAIEILSIDISGFNLRFIKNTALELGMNNIKLRNKDAFRFLKNCREGYDIIFADPPYGLKDVDKLPEIVQNNDLLNNNGKLIIEHSKELDLADKDGFSLLRKYGKVHFSFFE